MTEMTSRRLVHVCFALLIVVTIVDVIAVLRITNNHDFAVYYEAAQRLRRGKDIFAEAEAFRAQIERGGSTRSEETPWPYAYPPFFALLLTPLSLLSYACAAALWTALLLAAMLCVYVLILRSQSWLNAGGATLALLIAYQFQPFVVGLRLGQVDILVLLLFTLALIWLKQGADVRAGIVLGMAIGIKLFGGFLALFLLWKRRWKAALIAGGSGALFALGSFALTGTESVRRYLDFSSLYTSGAFAGYPYHQSINAFLTRTFKPNIFLAPVADLPWLADILTVLLSALLVVGLAWTTRRPAPPSSERFEMEYALAMTTMLLVIPPAPRYAFVWLAPVFLLVAIRLTQRVHALALVTLALAYILSARLVYFPLPLLRRLVMDGQFMLSGLLLWLTIGWLLARSGQQKGGA